MDGTLGFVGPLISVCCLNVLPYVILGSDYWVDLNELYVFMKHNYEDTDKREIPKRANMKNEISQYEFIVKEYQERTHFALGAVMKYFFQHSRDFALCRHVVDEVMKSLIDSNAAVIQEQKPTEKSIFELYTEVAKCPEIDCLDQSFTSTLTENHLPYIKVEYKTCFKDIEWKRIQLFEFSFSLQEGERVNCDSSQSSRKWSYWGDCISSLKLGKSAYKQNSNACSYQTNRMRAAAALEGITITVAGTCHLPEQLECRISELLTEFNIKYSDTILSVGCNEGCTHQQGAHLFLEIISHSEIADLMNIATLIKGSEKDHVIIHEIVFLASGTISSFQASYENKPRFQTRDAFLSKKLTDSIVFVYKESDDTQEDDPSDELQPCQTCFHEFKNWLNDPLTVTKFDRIKEWQLYVPLPVRLFFQKAFVTEGSIKRSQNPRSLAVSKITRLLTLYESSLNTLNKLFFGVTQEINTAELVVSYHNATSVFNVTQSAGITRSLNSAEQHLKSLASPERCYFKTYIAKHPLTYEAVSDSKAITHLISLRDCHIVFLVDNLVRIRTRGDPGPSLTKTTQVCTLPITVKGLPRNAKTTEDWHDENCDGSNLCKCKDAKSLTKDDINTLFLTRTEAEMKVWEEFETEAVWGMKVLLSNSTVKEMLETAGQGQKRNDNDPIVESALNMSFMDLSLHEIQSRDDSEKLEKSFANMSFQEVTFPESEIATKELSNRDSIDVHAAHNTEHENKTTQETVDHMLALSDIEDLVDNSNFQNLSYGNAADGTGNESDAANSNDEGHIGYGKADDVDVDDDDNYNDDDDDVKYNDDDDDVDDDDDDDDDHDDDDDDDECDDDKNTLSDGESRHCDLDEFEQIEVNTGNETTISIVNPSDDSDEDICEIVSEPELSTLPKRISSTNDSGSISYQQPVANDTCKSDVSSFVRFEPPALLCRHPPPAVGKDDDKSKLREILDDLLIKSGHFVLPGKQKEKILIATDHKVASNVFELIKLPRYKMFLPEFPVLHLMKSKITGLISAYAPAGIIQLLKYMKDSEDETDWKKIVSITEIETAVKSIRRLSIALHLAFFNKYLETLDPIEADNVLIDLENASTEETRDRWNPSYEAFIKDGALRNATFCLHFEIMQHCDEIVALQLAEKTGGKQGYTLLLSVVKSSLPFAFLNGSSSYAGFCVKLMNEHYTTGPYYQRMKETLFSTPHKDTQSNFALDSQREMDHRDVVRGFRPSSGISAVIPRMSVIDDLSEMRKGNQGFITDSEKQMAKLTSKSSATYLGKTITKKDLAFITRGAEMMHRINALSDNNEETPHCIYEKPPRPLTQCILDTNTYELGQYLVSRYICSSKLCGTNEDDCPDIDAAVGPSDLKKKIKSGKAVTINRNKCKVNVQKSECQIIEEKRKKNIRKLNKFSQHVTSEMNTCQAIVKPDGSKQDTGKATGIRDALIFALCQKIDQDSVKGKTKTQILIQRSAILQQSGLVCLQTNQYPALAISKGKVMLVEFAGVKFKTFTQSGKGYLEYLEGLIYSMLTEFPEVKHIVICEEKYTFTPDTFKAFTHAKREKDDKLDVFHLKSDAEMISLDSYSRSALTKTKEGKSLSSRFLGEHVHELQIEKDLTLDIDSDYLLSPCVCENISCHKQTPCKQFATPVRAVFHKEMGFVRKSHLIEVRQRKGEAELSQADWLPYIASDLGEEDCVISYVTSGDIDTLPIHLLATALYWPRLPNRKFKNDIFLILKKPGRTLKPDVYAVTKIVERLEELYRLPDISVIIAMSLCFGGNDYLPKFSGIAHTDWIAAILQNESFITNLFDIEKEDMTGKILSIKVNEEVYLNLVKQLYAPRGTNVEQLTIDEIRQVSIKYPMKNIRALQNWMPPVSALKKVVCLINSHTEYLLTVCKPEADLPDFLGNGGIRQTNEGNIVYDFGPDVHYNDELEILLIDENLLKDKLLKARILRSRKRNLPVTPSKNKKQSRRKLCTSTPSKDTSQKGRGQTRRKNQQ